MYRRLAAPPSSLVLALAAGLFAFGAVAAPIPDTPAAGKAVVWSAPLRRADPRSLGASAGVWTPDGKHVLTAGAKRVDGESVGEVRVWDAATGKAVRSFHGTATTYANRAGHLAVSPDGKTVAAGGVVQGPNQLPGACFVEVWDWDREEPRLKLGRFTFPVSGVAFSPDGKSLVAVDLAGTLQGWEAATGKPLFRAALGRQRVWGLAFHPTAPVVAVADDDGGIGFYDAATGNARTVISGRPGGDLSAAFSPDGRMVAYGGLGRAGRPPVTILDARVPKAGAAALDNPRDTANDLPDVGCVYQVAFSPDGKLLAAACQDKAVRLFDPATGRLGAAATDHADFVYSVAFSPDGRRLLSVGRDAVKVWAVAELLKRKPG
ncbi:MAG: hypothetical protein K2X82_26030 [Gemmataceae bacterium]|nr:hypothetical protein [Gemmataceae bacterium]